MLQFFIQCARLIAPVKIGRLHVIPVLVFAKPIGQREQVIYRVSHCHRLHQCLAELFRRRQIGVKLKGDHCAPEKFLFW
jgi:hypothetical protein